MHEHRCILKKGVKIQINNKYNKIEFRKQVKGYLLLFTL